jgi:hypothetical protein
LWHLVDPLPRATPSAGSRKPDHDLWSIGDRFHSSSPLISTTHSPLGAISWFSTTSAELARLYARALSLQWRRRTFALVFGALVSGHEIPFPGNRDFGSNLRPESDYARCPSARIDSIRLRSRQPSRNRNRTEAPVNFAAAVFVPLTRREHHFGHQQGRHNAATASRKEN